MSGRHHAPAPDQASARYRTRLAVVFAMTLVVMVVEIVTGIITGSLALISDAGHMATDALGLGMALAAIVAASRVPAGDYRTFGLYRLEILAALANAVLLFAVAGYVLYEAVQRFREPPDVLAGPMLIVAVAGLGVNLVAWRLLHAGASESLNVEGAYLEVIADLAGSLGVVTAAAIIQLTGWTLADPIFAGAIGIFILPRAWRLAGKAFRVLLQAAPHDIDMGRLRTALEHIEGVVDVHDLHVWTLTSGMPVASAHLMTTADTDPHAVLDQARHVLQQDHRIDHATLQVEPETHEGCATVRW